MSVEARIEKLEEGLSRAERRVAGASQRMKGLGDVAGNYAARGLRVMSAALSAAGAASAAQEKQWLSLSAIILTNFAVGGPVLGAISLLGAAAGFVMAQSSKAAKQWEEDMRRVETATARAADRVKAAQEKLFISRGGSATLFELEGVERRLQDLQAIREKYRGSTTFEAQSARDRAIAEQQKQVDLRNQLVQLAGAELQLTVDEVLKQAELLGIEDERERKIAEINQRWGDLASLVKNLAAAGADMPGPFGDVETLLDFLVQARDLEIKIKAKPEPEIKTEFSRWIESLGPQLSDSITAGLLDAALRGGKGFQEIMARTFENIAGQLLNLGISAGLQALAGGIFPAGMTFFQHGGIVTRPTLAVLGEGGMAERVEPIHSVGETRNDNSSQTFNVYVQGGDPRAVVDAIRHELRGANLRRALRAGGR